MYSRFVRRSLRVCSSADRTRAPVLPNQQQYVLKLSGIRNLAADGNGTQETVPAYQSPPRKNVEKRNDSAVLDKRWWTNICRVNWRVSYAKSIK